MTIAQREVAQRDAGVVREVRVSQLVLYDGLCGLCDRTVQFLLARDRGRVLFFAPLQGETASAVLARHCLGADLSTMVFVRDAGLPEEEVLLRSDGVLGALLAIGGPWGLLARVARLVPWPLRDAVYRWIAANRYRWFGRLDTCRVPSPEERRRFLD